MLLFYFLMKSFLNKLLSDFKKYLDINKNIFHFTFYIIINRKYLFPNII